MSIIANYQRLCQEIEATALKCGRDPREIILVVVSKGQPWSRVKPLYQTVCRQYGENRLQEALPKKEEAPDDVQWHFIGNFQKNKVRKAIGQFVLIHSVDSLELAEAISKASLEQGIVTKVLLQINTSGEASKHGMPPHICLESITSLLKLPGIEIKGLMTMAPLTDDETQIRNCFADLRQLRDRLQEQNSVFLPHLSMGMSNDFRIAIEEGATFLRIGSAIFSIPH